MTSVRAPDYNIELEIDADTFDAISGYFLDISLSIEGKTSELQGMLAIPQGVKEEVESGFCEAWLWLDEERQIERGTKIDIALIRLSEIEIMEHLDKSLNQYFGKHLFGYIGI